MALDVLGRLCAVVARVVGRVAGGTDDEDDDVVVVDGQMLERFRIFYSVVVSKEARWSVFGRDSCFLEGERFEVGHCGRGRDLDRDEHRVREDILAVYGDCYSGPVVVVSWVAEEDDLVGGEIGLTLLTLFGFGGVEEGCISTGEDGGGRTVAMCV